MGLYKTITVSPGINVYIWKIEESEEQLAEGVKLTDHCQKRLNSMSSTMHRRGFLSIRHLLAHCGYTDFDLYYDEAGKPHLKDHKNISITHSHEFTAIIVSDEVEVGVDIEKQRDKILKIANKFTPLEEYKTLANSDAVMRKLTIVWGAKESLYKICSNQGISFLRHMNVKDFSFKDGKTTAEILYKGDQSHYDINFLEFEGFSCTYALKMEPSF